MDSDYQDGDSDMECSDNDNECFDVYDYYNVPDDCDMEQIDPVQADPEYFAYTCLTEVQVEQLLNESVATLSDTLQITPSLAKVCGLFVMSHVLQFSILGVVTRA